MKLKELYDKIDGFSPFAFSEAYRARGAYDNSGILLDCGEVTRVLFSLDLSFAAVEEAKRVGADCVLTHHPAIWQGLKKLEGPLLSCARAGISVISAHLNLDAAEGGIDECLMEGLGGRHADAVMEDVGGGYGRVYSVREESFSDFARRAGETFRTARILCYGEGTVKKVASFCGAGFHEDAVAFALSQGADTIVSSEAKHNLIAEAAEKGLKILILTHYAAENYGFCRFAAAIAQQLNGTPCSVFTDERFL